MTHTYKIQGMTCSGCSAKVQSLLSKVGGVERVVVDLPAGEAKITMSRHIDTRELKAALKDHPKYQLTEAQPEHQGQRHTSIAASGNQAGAGIAGTGTVHRQIEAGRAQAAGVHKEAERNGAVHQHNAGVRETFQEQNSGSPTATAVVHEHQGADQDDTGDWLKTYKPILIILGYILLTTISVEIVAGDFEWMRWMNHFMAGFFLTFSFFKLLDLDGFADSYSTYDIIAKRWRGWGYLYAFTELALGLAYLTGFQPLFTNLVTFIVMGISIIGVLQSILNKRKIRCACLGAVFNLPMSTVTIIEDALMIGMSGVMLAGLL